MLNALIIFFSILFIISLASAAWFSTIEEKVFERLSNIALIFFILSIVMLYILTVY
jgi:hypothetical protein